MHYSLNLNMRYKVSYEIQMLSTDPEKSQVQSWVIDSKNLYGRDEDGQIAVYDGFSNPKFFYKIDELQRDHFIHEDGNLRFIFKVRIIRPNPELERAKAEIEKMSHRNEQMRDLFKTLCKSISRRPKQVRDDSVLLSEPKPAALDSTLEQNKRPKSARAREQKLLNLQ